MIQKNIYICIKIFWTGFPDNFHVLAGRFSTHAAINNFIRARREETKVEVHLREWVRFTRGNSVPSVSERVRFTIAWLFGEGTEQRGRVNRWSATVCRVAMPFYHSAARGVAWIAVPAIQSGFSNSTSFVTEAEGRVGHEHTRVRPTLVDFSPVRNTYISCSTYPLSFILSILLLHLATRRRHSRRWTV